MCRHNRMHRYYLDRTDRWLYKRALAQPQGWTRRKWNWFSLRYLCCVGYDTHKGLICCFVVLIRGICCDRLILSIHNILCFLRIRTAIYPIVEYSSCNIQRQSAKKSLESHVSVWNGPLMVLCGLGSGSNVTGNIVSYTLYNICNCNYYVCRPTDSHDPYNILHCSFPLNNLSNSSSGRKYARYCSTNFRLEL